VQQERAVGSLEHLHALDRAHGRDDVVEMRRVGREECDVAHLRSALDADQVDRAQ